MPEPNTLTEFGEKLANLEPVPLTRFPLYATPPTGAAQYEGTSGGEFVWRPIPSHEWRDLPSEERGRIVYERGREWLTRNASIKTVDLLVPAEVLAGVTNAFGGRLPTVRDILCTVYTASREHRVLAFAVRQACGVALAAACGVPLEAVPEVLQLLVDMYGESFCR